MPATVAPLVLLLTAPLTATVTPVLEEIVVRARKVREASAGTSISPAEAQRVPGTQGDALKVVQSLPGVTQASVGSGQLIVWGAAPKDTRVVIDGVEVPALYHLGGLRSTLSSALVGNIVLEPGAYGAEFGRGLGGLVRVTTGPLPQDGLHGFVAADLLDAAAMLAAAVTPQLRVAVAGRYSYLDRLLSAIGKNANDLFVVPRYGDYQLKATLDLRHDEQLDLLFLGSHDRAKRILTSADPNATQSDSTDLDFYRGSLRYSRLLSNDASVTVVPSIGWDRSRAASVFGGVPAELSVSTLRFGLRGTYRHRLFSVLALSVGADALGSSARVVRDGSITIPAREGDLFVFGQPPGDDVNHDDFSARIVNVAPFVFVELELGPITVTPGLRLDAYLLDGTRLTPRAGATPSIGFSRLGVALDPRLSIRYRAAPWLTLSAAAGVYHQAPEAEELSAVFGSPTLGLSRAIHATGGGTFQITSTLSAELLGFYERFDTLVTRSALPTPMLARAFEPTGSGSSYGAQVLLRQKLAAGFFGWVSYAFSRSERTDVRDGSTRLFDFDQTHLLSLVASYELAGFAFGARFRCSTGFPRTPVEGSFFDAKSDRYQPIFGAHNSVRLPAFIQLDLSVQRSFDLSSARLSIYLDVQNVTYRRNAEEVVYNFDFSERGYITGLPILASLGARVEF